MLVQCGLDVDHYAGLDRLLAERGIASERVFPDQPPARMTDRTRVVVIHDSFACMNALAVRQARRIGATTVLVMDGLVEYRNTFVNPWSGEHFLRPAPVDVIACAGEIDRGILGDLGNDAVATGLPRLARPGMAGGSAGPLPLPDRPAVMVATANRPSFNDDERQRLVSALVAMRASLEALGVPVVWRLTDDLDGQIGVIRDTRPLRTALADVSAVITTPSTLMVEAMIAGRPIGLLHAHPTPLWQPATWAWRCVAGEIDWSAATQAGVDDATLQRLRARSEFAGELSGWFEDPRELVASILAAGPAAMARQQQLLRSLHEIDGTSGLPPGAARLADAVSELLEDPRASRTTVEFRSPVRVAGATPAPAGPGGASSGRPRVINCVVCDESPVGGVRTWALRLARAFADEDLGYDVRTLLIAARPDAWRGEGVRVELDQLTELCVVDPCADNLDIVGVVRRSIESMLGDAGAPGGAGGIVIPNYSDVTYAAAMQLRAKGVRTVALAHTDEPYYRELISTYSRWDGAVGVSRACLDWLEPIEEATRGSAPTRPLIQIPCVGPVAARPRAVEPAGPLKLAYFGRMVQVQKRIGDLLKVVDGLESRGTAYELHMVGDGVDLPGWRASLARRELAYGRVVVHGRKEPAWVERFLQTVDVSVLVSEFEGTSVSMLEAMGAGVVPAVTAVNSGVDEWVADGENGLIVPVGEPDEMAARLSELARSRSLLSRMGRAAWQTARRDASIPAMARQYRAMFDWVMARPMDSRPTDLGLRLIEPWRWQKGWAEDDSVEALIERSLRESGFSRIAFDQPSADSDAVIVRSRAADPAPSPEQIDRFEAWRARGLGVVFSPHLREPRRDDPVGRMCRLARQAVEEGCKRMAVYGVGKHTRRIAPLFEMGLPFVGFLDDNPPPWPFLFGLPIVPFDRAIDEFSPQAILLSSDAWEASMWVRCEVFRRDGIRVIPVYGTYDQVEVCATLAAPAA